jgi:hypothetical protein
MGVLLTPDEIEELTGATRSDAQRAELNHLGIPYRARRNGTIIAPGAAESGK